MFDLNNRFSVKFPPRGLVLRSQFRNLNPKSQKIKNCRKAGKFEELSGCSTTFRCKCDSVDMLEGFILFFGQMFIFSDNFSPSQEHVRYR